MFFDHLTEFDLAGVVGVGADVEHLARDQFNIGLGHGAEGFGDVADVDAGRSIPVGGAGGDMSISCV